MRKKSAKVRLEDLPENRKWNRRVVLAIIDETGEIKTDDAVTEEVTCDIRVCATSTVAVNTISPPSHNTYPSVLCFSRRFCPGAATQIRIWRVNRCLSLTLTWLGSQACCTGCRVHGVAPNVVGKLPGAYHRYHGPGVNTDAGFEKRQTLTLAFRFHVLQEILDFERGFHHIRRTGIHVGKPAGADVGVTHRFYFFDAVFADDVVEVGKTKIEFFHEHFRAEPLRDVGKADKIGKHDGRLIVFACCNFVAGFEFLSDSRWQNVEQQVVAAFSFVFDQYVFSANSLAARF